MSIKVDSLKSLRVFAISAKKLSFSQAANELFLTNAGVTRQIKGLEQRLGVKLFERNGNAIRLTSAGEQLLQEIDKPLESILDSLSTVTQSNQQLSLRKLNICVSRFISEPWLASRFVDFCQKHSDIQVQIESFDNLKKSRLGDYDLALFDSTYQLNGEDNIQTYLELNEFLVCSPEIYQQFLNHRDLNQLPLLHYGSKTFLKRWLSGSNQNHVNWQKGLVLTDFSILKEMVFAGQGVCLGDSLSCGQYIKEGKMIALPLQSSVAPDKVFYYQNPNSDNQLGIQYFKQWLDTKVAEDLALTLNIAV
ncbi:LysR family transcriptional regulator [Paraferrimonas sp. SM1919]|uniref:LysR family transcriptional regulator n=1 Tax=Paraferrimonas sp. SM1919 TaxID=2662263 RepID=UPI0013D6885B|nr:LysR family transcriptional regulator [Paraferrimonas sp. SM1919]